MQKTHKLMIKTHNKTGLKYLCYSSRPKETLDRYPGSGKLWKQHLIDNGIDIHTEVIFEHHDMNIFREYAKNISLRLDVVKSELWANERPESGTGGNTVGNKIWITDGTTDKYHDKSTPLPTGFIKGRTNCKFKDKNFQREMLGRQDSIKRSNMMKEKWVTGKMAHRDHSRCGRSGEDNPAKRPEVREKIRQAALKQSVERSERMRKNRMNGVCDPHSNKH